MTLASMCVCGFRVLADCVSQDDSCSTSSPFQQVAGAKSYGARGPLGTFGFGFHPAGPLHGPQVGPKPDMLATQKLLAGKSAALSR